MKYYGGCDVGSTYAKCVILDENGKIAADATVRSKIRAEESAISAIGLPSPTSEITSDSAKTVHCAVMGMGLCELSESLENSGSVISKAFAIAS